MATYDLKYPGAAIDAILDTAYHLQQVGYIFRGSASDYSGTPTEREWVIAPAGFSGLGLSSAVPQGSIGVCLYTGTAWVGKVINVLTLDSAPTRNSQNGVTSGGVAATLDEIAGGIMATFASLLFDDETAAADLSTKLSYAVKFSVSDVYQTVTHLNILSATTSKAGLMSAEDKAKVNSFLTNLRSLTFTDTTASADQGTKITETLKATIGGVQEVIDSITLLAATSSKAGLLSASDKAYIDALPATLTNLSNSISGALALMQSMMGYYVCDTAAGTAAKTVDATGYSLTNGGCIRIKMNNANTAANATLNINSTGAKALYYDGAQASSTNTWEAGEVLEVYYDGTQYQCASGGGGKFASGEKVKEVSIVNDLTSGGTTNILSAEQGKILYNESLFKLINRENVNTSQNGSLRNDSWITGTFYGHKAFIHDERYNKILIQANANSKNYVAFVESYTYPVVNGADADLCEGTSVIEIPANTVSILDVPSGCAYIIVSNSNNSSSWELPQKVSYINPISDEIYELNGEVDEILNGQDIKTSEQLLQLTWNIGYLMTKDDGIGTNSSWSYCDYVDVSTFKKIRIKGYFGDSYGLNMYDENHIIMSNYIPSGQTTRDAVVDIPQYCKYVRFCVKTNQPANNASIAAFIYQSFDATDLREEYLAKYNELYSDTLVEKLPEQINLGTVIEGRYVNGSYTNQTAWRCTENMIDIHVYKYLLTTGYYGINYGLEFYDVDGNRIGSYYGSAESQHTEYKVTIPDGVYYCRYSTKGTTIGSLKGIRYVSTTHQDIQDDITRIENMFVNAGYRYLAGNYGISEENEDNTSALQALVDTVNSEGGGIIEMPVGSFNFKGGITWRSNVYLVGQGEGVTTLNMVGTNGFSLFSGDNVNNIGMADFSVVASTMAANIGGKAMFMRYIEDAVFENLKLVDTQLTSLGIDFLNNVKIVNVHVINGGRGRWTASPSGVGCSGIGIGMGWENHKENFIISNCICEGCYNNGIFVEDQGRFSSGGGTVMADGSGQVIANNICRNGRNCGLSVWGGKKVLFSGNISYGNSGAGFEIGYYGEDVSFVGNQSIENATGFKISSISKPASHILFTENLVRLNGTAVSVNTGSQCNYFAIKDNVFESNTNGLVIAGDSTGLIIRDNDISNTSNSDVTISGTHTNAVIKGNTYMGTISSTATYSGVTTWVEQFNI